MTQQEQRIVAELDGWVFHPSHDKQIGDEFVAVPDKWIHEDGIESYDDLPTQYDDYNTIIPLIQKWCNATPCGWIIFLCELARRTTLFDEIQTLDKAQGFYNATPDQLLEALLKAVGKRKD
jgi:hypothetical protein